MSQVTVTLDIQEYLKDLNSASQTDTIGEAIVGEVKKMILSGVSPVTGERFEGYKAVEGYNAAKDLYGKSEASSFKKGYPYNVMKDYPGKTVRPVNLFLSGDMMDALTYGNNGENLQIGYIGASDKILTIAEAHNEGPTNDAFPQRRHIPTNYGEEFTTSIQRKILDLYTEALDTLIQNSK